MLATIAQEATSSGVDARWDAGGPAWLGALDVYGPWVLLAAVLIMLVRAALLRGRFRARGVLDAGDQQRVLEELAAVERTTVGEIVPVVLERSDRHPGASWLSALVTTVIGTLLFEGLLFARHDALLLVAVQVGLGLLGYVAAAAFPAWKRMFVSEKRASEMAEEQAFQEFYGLGLHNTQGKTGVLIFVSLLEKRVIVLGDTGINEKVAPELWQDVDRAILAGIVGGSLSQGLIDGIRASGKVLAEHFPVTDDDWNEIPDRLVVRKE